MVSLCGIGLYLSPRSSPGVAQHHHEAVPLILELWALQRSVVERQAMALMVDTEGVVAHDLKGYQRLVLFWQVSDALKLVRAMLVSTNELKIKLQVIQDYTSQPNNQTDGSCGPRNLMILIPPNIGFQPKRGRVQIFVM